MKHKKVEVKVDLVEKTVVYNLTLPIQVKVQARKLFGHDYEYITELIHPWPTNIEETPEELFINSIRKRALDIVVKHVEALEKERKEKKND